MEIWYILVWGLLWFIFGYFGFTLSNSKNIKSYRQDAINKSQSVMLWNISEKIVPMLPNFPYHSKDLVFVGKGFDYLVIDWLHNKNIQKIVFLEIKTAKSTLNDNEKLIRDAINAGKISYEIIKL